jgi:hypothetical protein
MRAVCFAIVLSLLPSFALAQAPSGGNVAPTPSNVISNPNNFPHPVQPWNSLTRPEAKGPTLAYITVPAQQVTIVVPEPAVNGEPVRWREQVVTVPGYVVTQTTLGYEYPERWTLEQTSPGVYQWRVLPAEFRRR